MLILLQEHDSAAFNSLAIMWHNICSQILHNNMWYELQIEMWEL